MGVVNDSNPWGIPHMPHHQIKGCFQKVSVTLPTKIFVLIIAYFGAVVYGLARILPSATVQ